MRPPSRQDEDTPPPVPKAKISNGGGSFSVGDKVRMDSMGMEGTMRFVGSIDGKPGVWAGVELSGGFAGRGKNDGSVDG
jgi:CAP-Gly domain-containing linker protein 1